MTAISADKVQAYNETEYCVEGPPAVRLNIGVANSELAHLYDFCGLGSCAFVTACNPSGKSMSDADNLQRLAELSRQLQRRRLPFFEGTGRHPTNGWPAEPSFLVLGIGLDEARELGAEWGQDAIVWCGADAVPRLILLR